MAYRAFVLRASAIALVSLAFEPNPFIDSVGETVRSAPAPSRFRARTSTRPSRQRPRLGSTTLNGAIATVVSRPVADVGRNLIAVATNVATTTTAATESAIFHLRSSR